MNLGTRKRYTDLFALVREQHPDSGMQTARSCVCGAGGGGPARPGACRDLLDLIERAEDAEKVAKSDSERIEYLTAEVLRLRSEQKRLA